MHSTHFIYGYMASDIWLRTILIVRKETRCRHIGYSFRLTARVLLYAPSHRQDSTYHSLCYTSRWCEYTDLFTAAVMSRVTFQVFSSDPNWLWVHDQASLESLVLPKILGFSLTSSLLILFAIVYAESSVMEIEKSCLWSFFAFIWNYWR